MGRRPRFPLRRETTRSPMRQVAIRTSTVALATVALAVGLSASACGSSPPPAPKQAAAAPTPTRGVIGPPATSSKGVQAAVSAGPSADSELSGDAKAAYDRGFQAWTSGDLQAAKTAFMDASSRAPSA